MSKFLKTSAAMWIVALLLFLVLRSYALPRMGLSPRASDVVAIVSAVVGVQAVIIWYVISAIREGDERIPGSVPGSKAKPD